MPFAGNSDHPTGKSESRQPFRLTFCPSSRVFILYDKNVELEIAFKFKFELELEAIQVLLLGLKRRRSAATGTGSVSGNLPYVLQK